MSFLLFELAGNPDVQDRLAKEIRDHDLKNGGKFDLNTVQSMTYLDMVISGGMKALLQERVNKLYMLAMQKKITSK